MAGGVDGDDVDLAERRVVVGVDLGPAEAGHLAVVARARGSRRGRTTARPRGRAGRRASTRPARGASRTPGCSRPATPPRPGRRRTGGWSTTTARSTGSGRRTCHRSRAGVEPDRAGEAVVGGLGLGDPEVDVAAARARHHVERGAEGGRRRLERLVGHRGRVVVVDQLQLPAPRTPDDLGVGEGRVPVVPGGEADDVLPRPPEASAWMWWSVTSSWPTASSAERTRAATAATSSSDCGAEVGYRVTAGTLRRGRVGAVRGDGRWGAGRRRGAEGPDDRRGPVPRLPPAARSVRPTASSAPWPPRRRRGAPDRRGRPAATRTRPR